MSTSGSTDFGLVTNTIIDEAFDICGIGSEGESISADQYSRARRSLNLMAKSWAASDHLWLRTSASEALAAATASYAITPKPTRILEMRRRDSNGYDTPLTEWSHAEYQDQPNKAVTGVPVAYYYDPQRASGTVYVWPTPGASEAAEYALQFTYLRTIEDFDDTTNDPDLPQEWTEALCYGLAERLALKYGVAPDIRSEIAQRAALLKAQIDSWDTEPASLFLQPEARW